MLALDCHILQETKGTTRLSPPPSPLPPPPPPPSPTPLYRVFTITHLKKTMFIGYIVLKLVCSHNLWHRYCYFQCSVFHTFTSALSKVCVQCKIRLSAVAPWCLLLLLLLLLLSQSFFQVHTMHTKQIVTYKCFTKVQLFCVMWCCEKLGYCLAFRLQCQDEGGRILQNNGTVSTMLEGDTPHRTACYVRTWGCPGAGHTGIWGYGSTIPLIHNLGTRQRWEVSSAPWRLYPPGIDCSIPNEYMARRVPQLVWMFWRSEKSFTWQE